MGKIITAYPTAGMTERTAETIITALYDYFSGIKPVTDFFEIEKVIGPSYTNTYLKFKKGTAYISMLCSSNLELKFCNNSLSSSNSPYTNIVSTKDIPIRYAVGINGTVVIWLDEYSNGTCMVFNAFENKYFLANSSSNGSNSFYYSDTGGTVNNLPPNFNGDNIGKGGEYIAQPYYHLGTNTGDIYTIDGGTSTIPWGEFSIDNAEFVRIYSNFALRLK